MKGKILLTGGTGMIGSSIAQQLVSEGYKVNILTRSKKADKNGISFFEWDIKNQRIDAESLEGVSIVIHLAGASVAKRWTSSYRDTIINSRVNSANLIYKELKKNNQTIDAFISASASGFYAANVQQVWEEDDQAGDSFLSIVCQKWEAAAHQFKDVSKRIVINRIGVVFSKNGGALGKMLPPFNFNLAPYFGNGQQFYPWIHEQDVVNQFAHSVNNPISGTFNACAGNISQKELNTQIAKTMNKSVLHMPAPVFALKLAMGDMHQIVTDSIQMNNSKIKSTGFVYEYSKVSSALTEIIGK